jgi:membrane-associated phospholipid phosphatase
MWFMAWKHYRPAFWVLAPVILSLYVSTFYGRYHYVTDTIFGIVTAGLAVIVARPLQRAWDRLAGSADTR